MVVDDDVTVVAYANMELWLNGKQDSYDHYVREKDEVYDAGSVGYQGKSGWYWPYELRQDLWGDWSEFDLFGASEHNNEAIKNFRKQLVL